jgi:hypothetical protein
MARLDVTVAADLFGDARDFKCRAMVGGVEAGRRLSTGPV